MGLLQSLSSGSGLVGALVLGSGYVCQSPNSPFQINVFPAGARGVLWLARMRKQAR
jgi:hypothetical protein